MSQENVDIVRRVYDALNRNDFDAAFRDAHPDFQISFKRGPLAGTRRGREAPEAVLSDMRAAFDAWTIEPSELLESRTQIVAIVKNRVRPKGTDAEIETRNGHLWTIRDGTILSLEGFPNADDALEAAGLRE
jgi:ketosteroid isomerase-like protein